MEDYESFDFINETYWHMFSYSQLNVFLDKEPTGNKFKWNLRRYVTYFFIFIYFPIWLVIEITGVIWGRPGDLAQIAFDISYLAHIIQLELKIGYFLYNIDSIRSLCLKFEQFKTSHHRPILSRKILTRKSKFLRKLADTYYTIIYMNLMFWTISPLIIQPVLYILTQTGVIESNTDTIIPKFVPVRYPFNEKHLFNRIAIAFLEFIVLTAGFIYFIPIDQFFVSVIIMVCAQIEAICNCIKSGEDLMIGNTDDRQWAQADDKNRIHLRLFIEDHQKALSITKKISQIMNPLLGVVIGNCMVLLCTLSIVITTKSKTTESFVEFGREISGFCLVMITSLITLFLYSWMCGELKASEESVFDAIYCSNWYEGDKSHCKSVLIVMGQSVKARQLKMLGTGDMDRETFIQGLRAIYTYYNFLSKFE